MFSFKQLYSATEGVIKALKEPLVRNRNERAVTSAIDDAIEQRQNAEEELEKVLNVVTEGKTIDVNRVISLRSTIKKAEATQKELEEFKTEFFS